MRRGCKRHSWRYNEIEKLVLTHCKGLNVDDLLRDKSARDTELELLTGKLAAIDGNLTILAEKDQNLVEQMATSKDRDVRARL